MNSTIRSARPYVPHLLHLGRGYERAGREAEMAAEMAAEMRAEMTGAVSASPVPAARLMVCKLCIRCRVYFGGHWDGNYICPRCGTDEEAPAAGEDSAEPSDRGGEQAA
ncbi:MAG: hypothetical protein ACRD13_11115 [Terriglobales bacterium]